MGMDLIHFKPVPMIFLLYIVTSYETYRFMP